MFAVSGNDAKTPATFRPSSPPSLLARVSIRQVMPLCVVLMIVKQLILRYIASFLKIVSPLFKASGNASNNQLDPIIKDFKLN